MENEILVSSQGIDKGDFSANGDYDSIEWGPMTREQLIELFQKLEKMEELDYSSDEDLCPPNILVENSTTRAADSNYGFTLNGPGVILFMDNGADYEFEVTPAEAVSLSIGEISPSDMAENKPESTDGSAQLSDKMNADQSPGVQIVSDSPQSRGAVMTCVMILGITVLLLGLLVIIGGEPGIGIFLSIVGFIPAFIGWKAKKSTSAKIVDTNEQMALQNQAMNMVDQDDDSDNGYDSGDFD